MENSSCAKNTNMAAEWTTWSNVWFKLLEQVTEEKVNANENVSGNGKWLTHYGFCILWPELKLKWPTKTDTHIQLNIKTSTVATMRMQIEICATNVAICLFCFNSRVCAMNILIWIMRKRNAGRFFVFHIARSYATSSSVPFMRPSTSVEYPICNK